MTANSFALSLEAAGLDFDARGEVYRAAIPCAILSGEVVGFAAMTDGLRWLRAEHPTRVNLILEAMGRPERISE